MTSDKYVTEDSAGYVDLQGDVAAAQADADTANTGLLAEEFELSALVHPHAQTNWSTYAVNAGAFLNHYTNSSGAQNALIVFRLPRLLRGGTWALVMMYRTGTNGGIFTVESSVDGAAWTAQTTVDSYAASTGVLRTEVAALTIPNLTRYIRFTMATKHASSSSYHGYLSGFSGYRTGA